MKNLTPLLPYLLSVSLGIISTAVTICLTLHAFNKTSILIIFIYGLLFHLGFIQGIVFYRSRSVVISYLILFIYEILILLSLLHLVYISIFREFINLDTWLFILEDLRYFMALIFNGNELRIAVGGISAAIFIFVFNYFFIIRNNPRSNPGYIKAFASRFPWNIVILLIFFLVQAALFKSMDSGMKAGVFYPFGGIFFFIYFSGIVMPDGMRSKVTHFLPMAIIYALFTIFSLNGKNIAPAGFDIAPSHLAFHSLHFRMINRPEISRDPEIHGKNVSLLKKIVPEYNVLIIINDSLRFDHLGMTGYRRNPERLLEPWLREWFYFRETFSASNNTSIAAPSLFSSTGTEKSMGFLQNNPRLWDYFDESVNTFFISSERLDWKGFDKFIDTGRLDFAWDSVKGMAGKYGLFDDRATQEKLIEHLGTIKGKFVGVWHNSYAHYPYKSGKGSKLYLPESIDREKRGMFINRYDNSLVQLSENVSRFLDYMKSTGLYDNTIIVFTADHAESLGERGIFYHGKSLYPEEIHVPLFIHLPPALVKSLSVEELRNFSENQKRITSTLDILPTIVYLLDRKSYRENSRFISQSQGRALLEPIDRGRMVLSSECFSGYVCLNSSYAFISMDYYFMLSRKDGAWDRKLYRYSSDRKLEKEINDRESMDRAEGFVRRWFSGLYSRIR